MICKPTLAMFVIAFPSVVSAQSTNQPVLPADGKSDVTLEAQLFSGFAAQAGDGLSRNEFEVVRSELGIWLWPTEAFGGEVRIESLRSAGGESVTGIDRDSLVFRLKRGWAFGRHQLGPVRVEGRIGLVPDLWIEALESMFTFRGSGPTLGERSFFYDTSDLGAQVRVVGPEDALSLGVSVTNGEGRNQIEQNDGKNVAAVAMWRALSWADGGALHILVAGSNGSVGAAAARAHRVSAAVSAAATAYAAGVEVSRAWGVMNESERTAEGIAGWGSAYVNRWRTGVLVRADLLNQDRGIGGDTQTQLTGGLYLDALGMRADRRARFYVLGRVDRFGDSAAPLPGIPEAADSTSLLLLMSLHGSAGVL